MFKRIYHTLSFFEHVDKGCILPTNADCLSNFLPCSICRGSSKRLPVAQEYRNCGCRRVTHAPLLLLHLNRINKLNKPAADRAHLRPSLRICLHKNCGGLSSSKFVCIRRVTSVSKLSYFWDEVSSK